MKRKIILTILLLFEAFVLFVFGCYKTLGSPDLLKPIYDLGQLFFDYVIAGFRDLCHLNTVNHGSMIACVILNVIFIILYALIFGLIAFFIRKAKMKKIRKVVTIPYKLSEEEKELFEPARFKKRVPWFVWITLIIPVFLIALGLVARTDVNFSKEVGANVLGTTHLYTDFVQKYFHSTTLHSLLVKLFTNGHHFGYMDIINKIPENLAWLEYVIISLGTVLVLVVWFFIFYLLYLPFRGLRAKGMAKRREKKYVYKQELKEYKYRNKHKGEYTSKSEEFMHLVEDENQEKQNIAKNTISKKKNQVLPENSDYFDDLGSSVRDLGVGTSEEVVMDKPFIEREVRYVSDSDFDIVLENEPVIEVAEEEGIDTLSKQNKEDELFYEKYQPDSVDIKPFEEYDQSRTIVSDYVNNINEEEPIFEEKKEEVKKPEPVVEKVVETPVVEEKKEETLIQENTLTPLEKYRLEKKKATEERDRLLQEGTLNEDNDPLKKYRKPGVRAGKVEAKVPTMAEIDAEKKVLHDERSKRIKEGLAKKRQEQLAAARLKAKNSKQGGEKKVAPQVHDVAHTTTPKRKTSGEKKVPPHSIK